jgi:hypothetical protein
MILEFVDKGENSYRPKRKELAVLSKIRQPLVGIFHSGYYPFGSF